MVIITKLIVINDMNAPNVAYFISFWRIDMTIFSTLICLVNTCQKFWSITHSQLEQHTTTFPIVRENFWDLYLTFCYECCDSQYYLNSLSKESQRASALYHWRYYWNVIKTFSQHLPEASWKIEECWMCYPCHIRGKCMTFIIIANKNTIELKRKSV